MQDFIQHIINGISLGSIYALIALGYTMVYGILKMINFAHSDVYMVGAFAAYYVARFFGIDASPGIATLITLLVVSMVCCSLLGLAIERLAYRPLRNAPKLNVLITAIGVSLFLEYAGQVVFGADPKVFPEVMKDMVLFNIGDVELKSFDVTVLIVSVLAMLGLQFLIFKTKLGRAMRAVSANASVASLLGVNPDRIIAFTFIVGSSLAGVGSVLVGMKYPKIDPLMGMMIGLKAFVAAVLGGIGNVGGAVLGALIMGLSEEMVVAYLSSTYRDALAFGILIVILIFKPAGLLGKYTVEKV
ncbi:branched-chain amino acid ABC transporter permease [Bdellovibrio sp. BCCA]|uniref:branched-chain amino acid ABC transporter permease n=1 Tax=unclassified Bdellovibrio TaxID=2633795 RepID=UPI0025D794A7|nr:branched-chain amino acid ABC transporter permease [uncultured Bdellovibrio sp.]